MSKRYEVEYFLGYEDYDGTNASLMPLVNFVTSLGRIQGFGPYGPGLGLVSLASPLPLPVIIAYLRRKPELFSKVQMFLEPPGRWRA